MSKAEVMLLRTLLSPSCFRLPPSDWMGDPEDDDEEEEEKKKQQEEDDEEDEDNEGEEEEEVPWQVRAKSKVESWKTKPHRKGN